MRVSASAALGRARRGRIAGIAVGGLLLMALGPAAADEPNVTATDSGVSTQPATWECVSGHPVEKRSFTLDNGRIRYGFAYSGCVHPSHGEKRPSSEGNFGMPSPVRANFYAGGFIGVIVNGEDAVTYRVADMQVLEQGARGCIQAIFAHPDAQVGLRLLLLPESNHVLVQIRWLPREGAAIESVRVKLICYPSFFTTFHHRQGERHVATPRTDQQQVSTLQVVPGEDGYLYYYDAVFDVAKGEGDGPCAALPAPEGLSGGTVSIGDYAVVTHLDYAPQAGEARLALYDFAGLTNAQAAEYLAQRWQADRDELRGTDFRPEAARTLDLVAFESEVREMLARAADDGEPLRPRVEELLGKLAQARDAAAAGDWQAEASLSALLRESDELLWRLRIFALLN
ncbi:MAG: hypothetical protein AB7Y46_04220 [Armatimonadota bacterium]